VAYAVSKDGLTWEKPKLGLVDFRGSKENNLVPCGLPRDLHQFGNVRDPDQHYGLTMDFRVGGWLPFCRELPDFINDPDWREKLEPSGGIVHSHYTTLEFWDDLHQEWVVMRQAPNHPPVRCAGRYASPDLKNWTLEHYLYPDAHDSTDPQYFEEVYGLMSVHVEGMVLGFAYWFIGDRTHSNPELYEDGHNRPTTEEGLIGKSVCKGTMEVRLVASRDGAQTWDRAVSREAWIPHGRDQHSYDRCVRIDCPPLRMGDEDWFYCSGYDGDHCASRYYHDRPTSNIRGILHTQKHNRYVSLTAGTSRQILITKPLKVTGKMLQLNVDASRGEVRVGIDKWIEHKTGQWPFKAKLPHWMVEDRWEQSHLAEGFHINDCLPIHGNCIEQNVRWNAANLEPLLGQTVRLYIMAQDADLYGFRFR